MDSTWGALRAVVAAFDPFFVAPAAVDGLAGAAPGRGLLVAAARAAGAVGAAFFAGAAGCCAGAAFLAGALAGVRADLAAADAFATGALFAAAFFTAFAGVAPLAGAFAIFFAGAFTGALATAFLAGVAFFAAGLAADFAGAAFFAAGLAGFFAAGAAFFAVFFDATSAFSFIPLRRESALLYPAVHSGGNHACRHPAAVARLPELPSAYPSPPANPPLNGVRRMMVIDRIKSP